MKSKFTKKPDPDLEQDDDDVEVETGGPSIASAKKSKIMVILASSALITLVLYFLFFKESGKKPEKLEEIEVPKAAQVAPSEEGKSPFEIEPEEKPIEEMLDFLAKPAAPEIPTLPELPADSLPSQPLITDKQLPTQSGSPLEHLLPVAPATDTKTKPIEPQQQASTTPAEEQKKPLDPRYSPIVVFSGVAEGTPSRGIGYENNIVDLSQDPIDQLQKTKASVVASYIDDRVHTIAQGKLFSAVLETAIDTQIPGSVRAVISRDVYGESGNEILISKGSRLFGSYSSQINRGQGRVQISWSRLIRSDGVDLAIGFNASDQFGRAGISGDVDNRYSSIITNSLLTSILAVGGVAAVNKALNNSDTTTTVTSTGTITTGNATNQAIADVSKTIVDTVGTVIGNGLNLTPVIRVPQGTKITVIVNADINVPSFKKRKF